MPLQPGQSPSRAQFNRVEENGRRVQQMRGGPGLLFRNTPAGVQLATTGGGCFAQITGLPGGAGQGYAWVEVVDDGAGGFGTLIGGGTGTATDNQIFTLNSATLNVGDVCWIEPAPNSKSWFAILGGGGAGAVTIRIVGPPVTDGNLVWYYPGNLQLADPVSSPNLIATPPSINYDTTDGTLATVSYNFSGATVTLTNIVNAWVTCLETYTFSGIDQTIGGDGSAKRICVKVNKPAYDPISASNPTGPYALQVYQTEQIAYLINAGCDATDGTIGGERLEVVN